MARQASRKKSKKKAAPERGRAVKAVGRAAACGAFGTPERTSRAIVALVLLVVVGAWFIAKPSLVDRARVARQDTFQVTFNWPDLLSRGFAAEREFFERRVYDRVTFDPFDQESLDAARQELLKTGWFREVRVSRGIGESLSRVRVEGDWRRPEAMVMQDGYKFLVDRDGYVLERPSSLFGNAAYVIVDPPGAFQGLGQPWSHEAVANAVRVLAHVDPLIDRARYGPQIRGVDFSGARSPGTIVLMTDTGSRIVWGSPLGQEAPVTEPGANEKLTRMSQVLRDYGRIDANAPELDLRRSPLVVPRATVGR